MVSAGYYTNVTQGSRGQKATGLSPSRLAVRRKYVGASEVPGLLLPEHWFGPAELYYLKRGEIKELKGNQATELGQRLEAAIIDWAVEILRLKGGRRNVLLVDEEGYLCATLDYRGPAPGNIPVEAKTVGFLGRPRELADWGEPGTDQVPPRVMLQVQVQIACSRADRAFVTPIIPGRGLQIYVIERNERLIAICRRAAREFIENHVRRRKPPRGAPSLDYAALLPRESRVLTTEDMTPSQAATLAGLVDEEREAAEALRACEDRLASVRARIVDALRTEGGDLVEGARWEWGPRRYSVHYGTVRGRTSVDLERLRRDWPEAYEQVVHHGEPFRRFRSAVWPLKDDRGQVQVSVEEGDANEHVGAGTEVGGDPEGCCQG